MGGIIFLGAKARIRDNEQILKPQSARASKADTGVSRTGRQNRFDGDGPQKARQN
jgi:hypothetical protein